jgi:hypothetical protein
MRLKYTMMCGIVGRSWGLGAGVGKFIFIVVRVFEFSVVSSPRRAMDVERP